MIWPGDTCKQKSDKIAELCLLPAPRLFEQSQPTSPPAGPVPHERAGFSTLGAQSCRRRAPR
jgi:hypothetical protein